MTYFYADSVILWDLLVYRFPDLLHPTRCLWWQQDRKGYNGQLMLRVLIMLIAVAFGKHTTSIVLGPWKHIIIKTVKRIRRVFIVLITSCRHLGMMDFHPEKFTFFCFSIPRLPDFQIPSFPDSWISRRAAGRGLGGQVGDRQPGQAGGRYLWSTRSLLWTQTMI